MLKCMTMTTLQLQQHQILLYRFWPYTNLLMISHNHLMISHNHLMIEIIFFLLCGKCLDGWSSFVPQTLYDMTLRSSEAIYNNFTIYEIDCIIKMFQKSAIENCPLCVNSKLRFGIHSRTYKTVSESDNSVLNKAFLIDPYLKSNQCHLQKTYFHQELNK